MNGQDTSLGPLLSALEEAERKGELAGNYQEARRSFLEHLSNCPDCLFALLFEGDASPPCQRGVNYRNDLTRAARAAMTELAAERGAPCFTSNLRAGDR